jgi:competence protein ComEA
MKKWLDKYFGFTRREFNGLMTLIILILLVIVFPHVHGWLRLEEPITEAEQLAVLKLSMVDKERVSQGVSYKRNISNLAKIKSEFFFFDPNVIGQVDWERLGLSAKQARAILKYRSKGGKFRKPEDLRKMYTISSALYIKLIPFVRIAIEDEVHFNTSLAVKPRYAKPALVVIEINAADTIELDKIRGIGMTFANRIVNYRERIGGFYKKEQLMEVFGLDTVKYEEIKDQVRLDLTRLKKINVNTAQFDDFRKHPYLRYKQINALIQYRKQHGNYSNIADLYKVAIMSQETITRLTPYLEF